MNGIVPGNLHWVNEGSITIHLLSFGFHELKGQCNSAGSYSLIESYSLGKFHEYEDYKCYDEEGYHFTDK